MIAKVLILLFILTIPAYGATPTYDNAASTQFDTAIEATIVGFTTTGSNRLLTSCLRDNGTGSLTAHHYNASETMTSVLSATMTAPETVTLYRRINPTSGGHDLVATWDNVVNGALGAISFAGVNQSTPLGTAVKAEGGLQSAGATVTVSSATDELVMDCFATSGDVAPTEGASQTERWEEEVMALEFSNGSTKAGAASVAMSRAWSPDDFQFTGLIGVSVKPVSTLRGAVMIFQ